MDAIAKNLKRAYCRSKLPDPSLRMAELLRQLARQEAQDTAGESSAAGPTPGGPYPQLSSSHHPLGRDMTALGETRER